MIWLILFYIMIPLTLKSSMFLSDSFILESSSLFMTMISPICVLLILVMNFSFKGFNEKLMYNLLFLLVIFFVSLTFVCSSSFHFLWLLELTVIPLCFLIMVYSKDFDKISAVLFMMIINLMGSIPFMIFVFSVIENSISCLKFSMVFINSSESIFTMFCFLLMLCSKLPIFLMHFWLTKAHVSASGSCSMVLASLMLKLGSFGILKFFFFHLSKSRLLLSYMFSLGLLGALIFSILMIRFFDMKYLIASSSVIHMSLIFPSLMMGASTGLVSSLFMMVGHGVISYFLFFLVTMIYENSFNRFIDLSKCLESFSKMMSMIFFIYLFLNLGVPPLINFLSELLFMKTIMDFSLFSMFIFFLVLMNSIMFTMFFSTKIIFGKFSMKMMSDFNMNLLVYGLTIFVFSLILPVML